MDRNNLFGSLKNKLSRNSTSSSKRNSTFKSSNSPSSPASRMSNDDNPLSNPSPPTRRPISNNSRAFEPPPAYSPAPNASAVAPQTQNTAGTTSTAATTADDPYAFLSSFDTIFLIDDSGSMAGRSWRETRVALETITPICTQHDADGIDIHFLNAPDNAWYHNVKLPSTVSEIFSAVRPQGGTMTGTRLNQLLRPYLQRYLADPDNTKPLNIICITDGVPSDDPESVLINAAKKLDKADAPAWQIGIQFFQVGNEPGAKEYLKQLDDGLREVAEDDDLRDIVDTVPLTGKEGTELTADGILKVVLGAVHKKLDRKSSKDLHRKTTG